ncbi:MAG: hypothetical protein WB780_06295 [Candidatus Acidiferrales bacterium]
MKRFLLGKSATLLLSFGVILCATPAQSQTTASDPQAISVLQQSVAAMGTTAPSDSTATGTITTIAGSLTESGTITILTRGTNQTSEQIQTPHGSTTVYSQGQASQIVGSTPTLLTTELSLCSQSSDFPLPLLTATLNNPDTAYKYVGLESLKGASAHHVQIWNTYNSTPWLQSLSSFTVRDIWLDAASFLPQRFSYIQRVAGGSEPGIAVDVYYSNYQNVVGALYPFSIQKSYNGTPSATITIQNVVLNTGLSDSDFPI